MTDSGVRQMLERRCKDAGIPPIHPTVNSSCVPSGHMRSASRSISVA
jgi:hypothetical protein